MVKINSGILNRITGKDASTNSKIRVRENQVNRVEIPPHFVKSINLPKFTADVTSEQSGFATDARMTAQQGDFEDLQISFYMAGDMANILPEIFFAYYLNFGSSGEAEILYLQKGLNFASDYNKGFVSQSNIQISLMNNDTTRYLNYNNVLPVSFDLGEVAYADSDIIEATMNFQYNVPWDIADPFAVTPVGRTAQEPTSTPASDTPKDTPKSTGGPKRSGGWS